MTLKTKRIGYGVYIISIGLFFLYTLFPTEALTAYLANQLSGGRPDLTVTIDRVKPLLPPGLKLQPLRYAFNGQPLFEFSQMSIWPELLAIFKSGSVYTFEGSAYGGRVAGEIGPFDADTGEPLGLDARLSAFQIERIPALGRVVPQKLTGRLDGKLNKGDGRQLNANLTAAKVGVQLRVPLFGLKVLNFETVTAELSFDGQRVALKQCIFKGSEMDGNLSGAVRLDGPGSAPTLNLKGTVSPHHAFLAKIENSLPAKMLKGKDTIGFKLTGSIHSPSISFE